jgi:hypothetical protein
VQKQGYLDHLRAAFTSRVTATNGPRRELPPEDVEAIRRDRIAQGLPPAVEDPALLSRLAALLDADSSEAQVS